MVRWKMDSNEWEKILEEVGISGYGHRVTTTVKKKGGER